MSILGQIFLCVGLVLVLMLLWLLFGLKQEVQWLTERVDDLEADVDLLDRRCKDLLRMVLMVAKEARGLDPGVVDRSLESLREKNSDISQTIMTVNHMSHY